VAYDLLWLCGVKVTSQNAAHHIVVVVAVVAAVGAFAVHLDAEAADGADALIQRVIAHVTRSGQSLQSTRELRAGTVSGKHQGWMTVETALTPAGAFSWRVVEQGGSQRTREKVLSELLKIEAEAWRTGHSDDAALTPTNYVFNVTTPTPAGTTAIRVIPRRLDAKLIDGVLVVGSDGFPIRLEGRLAKSPSFWVRSVTVVKKYARFGSTSLPISIESLADIKMFGRSSLTMRYRYTVVNGRSVSHAIASAPLVGPSAEILALHESVTQQ
jgi:hypothetical protein